MTLGSEEQKGYPFASLINYLRVHVQCMASCTSQETCCTSHLMRDGTEIWTSTMSSESHRLHSCGNEVL
jgi:hypothetical protein